jgi:hypothetical protein
MDLQLTRALVTGATVRLARELADTGVTIGQSHMRLPLAAGEPLRPEGI